MQVSIIGAGLTGCVIAHQLQQQNFASVKVYEKSRGRGGRMATKRLQWGHMDMGAQYFTVKSDSFKQTAALWRELGWIEPWDFTPMAENNGLVALSPDTQTRYVATPDMNSLCKQLLTGVDTEFYCKVTHLSRTGKYWHLYDDHDELLTKTETLVLTCPLEQTRALLEDFPDVLAQLPESAHLPCWSVGVATEGKVDDAVQGIFAEGDLSWISRQNTKPHRANDKAFDLWSLQFSPHWSENHLATDSDSVITEAFAQLGQRLKASGLCDEHFRLVNGYSHFWRYARPNPNTEVPNKVLSKNELSLIVAGDWCFGGRVEGAFLSAEDSLTQLQKMQR